MKKSASLSPCHRYRYSLLRQWDERPMLLVVMFNPSTADAEQDDPTIRILCQVASHNGYGGIQVVNAIPLRSPNPDEAVAMLKQWQEEDTWYLRDPMLVNMDVILKHLHEAGAVLLAWGALAERAAEWLENLQGEIAAHLPEGRRVFCLGKTAGGHPKHPMARGKHKVRPDQPLVPWTMA